MRTYYEPWIKLSIKGRTVYYKVLQKDSSPSFLNLNSTYVTASHLNDALFQAVGNDNIDLLNQALEWGAEVTWQNSTGQNPLQYAAFKNKEKIALYLAKRPDIDINFQDGQKTTALHFAARGGAVEIVKALLQRPEIKIDLIDAYGRTPLNYTQLRIYSDPHCIITSLLLQKLDAQSKPLSPS